MEAEGRSGRIRDLVRSVRRRLCQVSEETTPLLIDPKQGIEDGESSCCSDSFGFILCAMELFCIGFEIRELIEHYSWVFKPKERGHYKGCWELQSQGDVPDCPCPCTRIDLKLKRIKELQQRLQQHL